MYNLEELDMNASRSFSLFVLSLVLLSVSWVSCAHIHDHESFLQCLSLNANSTSIAKVIYTPNNSSYTSVLQFPVTNRRFLEPSTPKPQAIVTPLQESHIQSAIICSRKYGLQIRVRSGGHDYEGLSFVADVPFVVIDLIAMRSIDIDAKNRTAWVQSGANNGELYYDIAQKSRTLGFTAGICPTVGSGGHFSGGGWGFMMRKHGLAADNVIDARFIDANGKIHDRKSMGEDLFWAIRGGGGGSFGIVSAWKLRLVTVPPIVTVFEVHRTSEKNVTNLVDRWQHVASKLPREIFIRIAVTTTNSTTTYGVKPTIQAIFRSLFLGRLDGLLPLMQKSFPELGLVKEDCKEMSWIESMSFIAEFGNPDLRNRTPPGRGFAKLKSDYVTKPIPKQVFDRIWESFFMLEVGAPTLFLTPYGGRMDEIPASETPFPHRVGNLYHIQYAVIWLQEGAAAFNRHMDWIRMLYKNMTRYVSKSPRAAYVNYRDLDIGVNDKEFSIKAASVWGHKYFKDNFERLVHVKTMADPSNFFRSQQSIPPLSI